MFVLANDLRRINVYSTSGEIVEEWPAPGRYCSGGGIVAGTSDAYRYQVYRQDGSRLVVERYWDPVPIRAQRREYERRYRIGARRAGGDVDFDWDGSGCRSTCRPSSN